MTFHAKAVAAKPRRGVKKNLKEARKRASASSKATSRAVAAKAKTAPRAKAKGKGAKVTANNKKTAAPSTVTKVQATPKAPVQGKKAPELKKKVAEAPVKKKVELQAVPKAAPAVEPKKATQRQGFKTNEFIVYPAHGVGQIVAIEEQEVAGYKLELFVINFVKDKMTLRVPTTKIASVGMRKLAETPLVKRALDTLKGRARIKRTMWSRRAQEYEAKINSGDIVAISEVVRDLFRSESQPEQSYSERQLYEAALDRLAREIAAVQRITETEAVKEIEASLAKGPRRGPKPEAEAESETDEAVIEEEAA
ncbi:MAG: CarD family transcriptional regulator [Variibacter sp.]